MGTCSREAPLGPALGIHCAKRAGLWLSAEPTHPEPKLQRSPPAPSSAPGVLQEPVRLSSDEHGPLARLPPRFGVSPLSIGQDSAT